MGLIGLKMEFKINSCPTMGYWLNAAMKRFIGENLF
jgi:hypothetical protein